MEYTRRNFVKLSGLGLMISLTTVPRSEEFYSVFEDSSDIIPFDLGIASYTFRKFSLDDTIKMTRRVGITKLTLKSMHMPLESTPEEIRSIAARIREAGIDLYGAGVIYMRTAGETDQAFNYAKAAGLRVIIGVPSHELLDYCNQKVRDFDIKLAIHNHGPGDELYPSPESVYTRVKDLDPRIGLCVDIGHTQRLGLDPIEETAKYFDRLHDVHIKDEDASNASGNTVEIGRGVIDIPGYLKMLIEKGYRGVTSFEYEKDEDDPLPGLAESVGYVRGVLKTFSQ
ncbi:MAG: sugar phosphate isomerase/epimerase [Bacteroidales bacterium]|nr:MAG: sugar phosphate isomerase/epimerase [Bacteroidales bacterium]